MSYFPIFIELKNKNCLVIGGGKVALRKIKVLLDYGANVVAIAPTWEEELLKLEQENSRFTRITEKFQESYFFYNGNEEIVYSLIVAATNDRVLNEKVAKYSQQLKIPVNVVDNKNLCTFFFPAVVQKDPVSVGISTSGQSPIAASFLKKEIERLLDDSFLELVSELTKLKEELKQKDLSESERRIQLKQYAKSKINDSFNT